MCAPSSVYAECRTRSVIYSSFFPSGLRGTGDGQPRRDRHQHVHMVAVDRSGMNNDLMRARRLTQRISASFPNVPAQRRIALLRHPDYMILAVPNRVAAALVGFHPPNLYWKARDPSRLKALNRLASIGFAVTSLLPGIYALIQTKTVSCY